jgi:hypothetical protein
MKKKRGCPRRAWKFGLVEIGAAFDSMVPENVDWREGGEARQVDSIWLRSRHVLTRGQFCGRSFPNTYLTYFSFHRLLP